MSTQDAAGIRRSMRWLTAAALIVLAAPRLARADDGGSCLDDAGVPLVCCGALCDTTNGGCNCSQGQALELGLVGLVLVLGRRRARRPPQEKAGVHD